MTSSKIYYLDNLRAFCMIFGVYFHAAALGDYPVIEVVTGLSGMFRMEVFFFVSGFFAGMVSERRETMTFLRQRSMVLLIPFASVLVLVNPLTIYLGHGYHQNLAYGSYSIWEAYSELLARSRGGPELHLWFLAVLMVYILLFLAFKKSIKSMAAWCERNPRSHLLAPVVVAIVFGVYWCGFFLSARIIEYPRLVYPFVEDLPFFMIGAISAYSGTVLRRAQSFGPMLLILGVSSWLVMELYRGPGWGPIQMLARGVLSICLVVLVNCIFASYAHAETRLTRFFSTSIYTVYLFHPLFLIATLAALGFHYNEPSSLQILILATGVTLAGAVLHRYVIAPVGILSLLFLGKRGLSAPAMISRTTAAETDEG